MLSGGQVTPWKSLPLFKSPETLDPDFISEDNRLFFIINYITFNLDYQSENRQADIPLRAWWRSKPEVKEEPGTHLQRNINVILCCQALSVPPVGYRFAIGPQRS